MPTNHLQPMEFGEIYGSTFSLMRRTPVIALLAVVLIAAAWTLYIDASLDMFGLAVSYAERGAMDPGADQELQQEMGMAMMGALVPYLGAMVLLIVVFVFAQVAVTLASWNALIEEPLGTGEVLKLSFGRPFWVALLQSILIFIIFALLLGIASLIANLATGGAQNSAVQMLVMFLVCAYPITITSLRIHKVAIEHRGPWKGMIASIALVNPNLMRTLGIFTVAAIGWGAIIYIQSMLMDTPSSSFGMGGSNQDPEEMVRVYNEMMEKMTPAAIAVGAVLMGLATTFFYYLLTPVYADLRARRGEFLPVEEEEEFLPGGV